MPRPDALRLARARTWRKAARHARSARLAALRDADAGRRHDAAMVRLAADLDDCCCDRGPDGEAVEFVCRICSDRSRYFVPAGAEYRDQVCSRCGERACEPASRADDEGFSIND